MATPTTDRQTVAVAVRPATVGPFETVVDKQPTPPQRQLPA